MFEECDGVEGETMLVDGLGVGIVVDLANLEQINEGGRTAGDLQEDNCITAASLGSARSE